MICEICGGEEARVRHMTRSYGKGSSLLVIENVPVVSCPLWGELHDGRDDARARQDQVQPRRSRAASARSGSDLLTPAQSRGSFWSRRKPAHRRAGGRLAPSAAPISDSRRYTSIYGRPRSSCRRGPCAFYRSWRSGMRPVFPLGRAHDRRRASPAAGFRLPCRADPAAGQGPPGGEGHGSLGLYDARGAPPALE